MIRERSQLYAELRESRKEALTLANELDKSRTSGSDRELELQQKVQELTSRFRVIEEEMRSSKTKTPPSKGKSLGSFHSFSLFHCSNISLLLKIISK